MRTQDEILARKESRGKGDLFGFEVDEYIPFLDFEHAQALLHDDVTEAEWDKARGEPTRVRLLEKMEDYMPFAWEKASYCRGISAQRSILHYLAWIWLAEEDDLLKIVQKEWGENYQYYGKDILKTICAFYGWDSTEWDDGIRTNYY